MVPYFVLLVGNIHIHFIYGSKGRIRIRDPDPLGNIRIRIWIRILQKRYRSERIRIRNTAYQEQAIIAMRKYAVLGGEKKIFYPKTLGGLDHFSYLLPRATETRDLSTI